MALIFSIASRGRSRLAAGFNELETFSAARTQSGNQISGYGRARRQENRLIYIDAARIKVSRREGRKSLPNIAQ